ncbi:MAG: hypothetical protein ACTSRG_20580 [Candidatus Helarchaeota archaeon]
MENEKVHCLPIKEKIEKKLNLCGKFALITNDFTLDANAIIRIYKTTKVVEQEFHLLKNVFPIRSLNHRLPKRNKVHCALVIWGFMAFALIKFLFQRNNMEFTFEELNDKIKDGYISIGEYFFPEYNKSFRIKKRLNITTELKKIFEKLRLEFDYFDIELIPTIVKKNIEGD